MSHRHHPDPEAIEDAANARRAFDQAIAAGILSADPDAPNFAGLYMFMGTWDGCDRFKNCETRRYLYPVETRFLTAGSTRLENPPAEKSAGGRGGRR